MIILIFKMIVWHLLTFTQSFCQIHGFFRQIREFKSGSVDQNGQPLENPGVPCLRSIKARVEKELVGEIPKMCDKTFYNLLCQMRFK